MSKARREAVDTEWHQHEGWTPFELETMSEASIMSTIDERRKAFARKLVNFVDHPGQELLLRAQDSGDDVTESYEPLFSHVIGSDISHDEKLGLLKGIQIGEYTSRCDILNNILGFNGFDKADHPFFTAEDLGIEDEDIIRQINPEFDDTSEDDRERWLFHELSRFANAYEDDMNNFLELLGQQPSRRALKNKDQAANSSFITPGRVVAMTGLTVLLSLGLSYVTSSNKR